MYRTAEGSRVPYWTWSGRKRQGKALVLQMQISPVHNAMWVLSIILQVEVPTYIYWRGWMMRVDTIEVDG